MEREGFALMDTLVYYTRSLDKAIPEHSGQVTIRPFRPGEEREVVLIAGESFKGYFGHYHADMRLDRDKCDEAYVSWAERSCLNRDDTSEVLIAEMDGRIAGFATLRLNNPHEGEGVLFGVAPFAQNQGIYRSFMINGMRWCQSKRAQRMIVSTQITNVAVQKVWTRLGFEPGHSQYTFHRWFEPAGSG
jgi:GNAT superfamily N-acetyltransferase